jgi:iron complex outermembrane recepter protein
MKKLYLLLTILSCFAFNVTNANTISGIVSDTNSKPLSYVTILLLNSSDSTLVKGDITNEKGAYEFEKIATGSYIISCSNIGFQKYYSNTIALQSNSQDVKQNINLMASSKSIKEIKVINKKPMIEVKADKTVFNVEQSINATGSNALDLLRKSPGVRVDKDDNIEMRGKNNVLIYIDGKPNYLGSKDLAAVLKNLQASDIEAIELIANPSAKYDASGNAGIINIKLKKNKKFGTNGTANIGLAHGRRFPKYNAGIQLNNRDKRINIFGNYSINFGKNLNDQNFDRIQNGINYNFKSENVNDDVTHNAKFGLDYFVDSKNVIGFMLSGLYTPGKFLSDSKTFISNVGSPTNQVLIASNRMPISRKSGSINLNYKFEDTSGRSFNIDADYGTFMSEGKSYQPNTYWNANETSIVSQAIFRNYTPTNINIYSLKTDYEQNFLKGKLGMGAKSAYVRTDNDFQFFDVINNTDSLNTNRSNHFVYNEFVNAVYINYSRQINTKLSTQLGVRAEQTNSKGTLTSQKLNADDTVKRQYLNLFPSAGFSYNINKNHSIGMTYSRRIDRPSYQDLNPFENKLDELTYEKGNAFLRPQYTNSYDLTHSFMQFFTTSVSYSHISDMFMQTTDTTEFSRTYVTQKNFATMDVAGINISFPIPVKKWWMVYMNLAANHNDLQANFEGRKLRNRYYVYSAYADNTFTLPKAFSLNISGWFSGPTYWGGTFKTKPMGSLDLGLQKTFLNKKLDARLGVSDVFASQRWFATSNFSGLYVKGNGNWESRQVKLNLSYRLGNNQVAKQRERQLGSSKESDRIKGK